MNDLPADAGKVTFEDYFAARKIYSPCAISR